MSQGRRSNHLYRELQLDQEIQPNHLYQEHQPDQHLRQGQERHEHHSSHLYQPFRLHQGRHPFQVLQRLL